MTTAVTNPPADSSSSGQSFSPPVSEEQTARNEESSATSRLGYTKRKVTEALAALYETEKEAVLTIAAANSSSGHSLAESELKEIEQIVTRVIKRALAGVRAANRAIDKAKQDVTVADEELAAAKERVRVLRAQREDAAPAGLVVASAIRAF